MALRCPVCGDPDVRLKLRKGEVDILQCRACRLAFWQPEASFDAGSLYDAAYFDGAGASHGYDDYASLEPALRSTFRRRLVRLHRTVPGRLLDVGAAYGYAASEGVRAGYDTTAIEVSPAAAATAAQQARGRIVVGSAGALPFAAGSFDVITLWDVIEHLPDPHVAMAEIARCVRPGGRVALTTGDVESRVARLSGARWHLYTLPEHLFFHSRDSLRRLLAAHGLRVERVRAEGALYPVGYLLERIRKTLLGSPSLPRVRAPGAGWLVPVNLFDILYVEAVRLPS